MDMMLYFAPGACSQICLIALEEIGLPFQTCLVEFMRGQHRSPEYLALNPAGKVPLLLVDGQPIAQNPAIQTFLAKKFPEKNLLPFSGELLNDARILAALAHFAADLHPLVTRIRIPAIVCDAAPDRLKQQASAAMAIQLKPIDDTLAEQPWLLGEDWSSLDAYLYWVWFRITGAGFDGRSFANITAHHDRMNERPPVQRARAREAAAEADLAARGLLVNFGGPVSKS